jgi:hypothetical protein
MKSKFKKRNEKGNYPEYRSYSNRFNSDSFLHNKFIVPWQMEEKI